MAEILGLVAGTVALLQTVAQITDLISAIEVEQGGSDVVLSFRPVQKDRIMALHQNLLDLIKERQDVVAQHHNRVEALAAALTDVNGRIDTTLHKYGKFTKQDRRYSELS